MNELENIDIKEIIKQIGHDYFYHHLIECCEDYRNMLCSYAAGEEITETTVLNSETYKPFHNSKKMILDSILRDNKGRLHNLEKNNYDITSDEIVRIFRYCDRMIDIQEKKGLDYCDYKDTYAVIIYGGKPLEGFDHYEHDIERGDFEYGAIVKGDRVHIKLFQLQRMEVDVDMSVQLRDIDQVNYLLKNGRLHPHSVPSQIVLKILKEHERYMKDEKQLIEAYEYERDQQYYRSKMNEAKRSGYSQGIDEGYSQGVNEGYSQGVDKEKERSLKSKKENVKNLIMSIYHTNQNDWINECSEEQLDRVFVIISHELSYDEFKEQVLSAIH